MGRRAFMLAMAGVLWICLFSGPASAQTLDRIAAGNAVHIGFVPGQAPFAIENAGGPPTGYAIDLCNHVVARIREIVPGIAVRYTEISLVDAFDAVASGKIDLLCGAITQTLERREKVDFSQAIFTTGMTGLLRRDSPRDLHELFLGERSISPPRSPSLTPYLRSRIGVRQGSTAETVLRQAVAEGQYSVDLVEFEGHDQGLAALEARRIDAYCADQALLLGLLSQARDPARLVVGNRLLTREPYGIALARGDSDLRLLVDRALTDFYATPEFAALLKTYFGARAGELQPQIRAMAVPE